MRVRMTRTLAGAGFVWRRGAVLDIDEAEAVRLIAAGYAEPEAPAVEEARTEPQRTAAQPAQRRRTRR